jgi:hypothetical protein
MKGPQSRLISRKVYFLAVSLAAAVASCTVARISAEAATISDKNSSINLSLNSSAGMTDWLVDGTDALNQQWLWFRIGNSGPQFDISTISAPSITTLGTKSITAVYSNAQFGVTVSYTLTGSANGSGHSALTEGINFFNYQTNASLDLHLFLYSDFTLGGGPGVRNVALTPTTSVQTLGIRSNTVAFTFAPASHGEANTGLSTYNSITGGSPYTLNDTMNASSPSSDVTWAFEWDSVLAPNTSLGTISITDTLQVPEPSIAALAVAGLGLTLLSRRKGKQASARRPL